MPVSLRAEVYAIVDSHQADQPGRSASIEDTDNPYRFRGVHLQKRGTYAD